MEIKIDCKKVQEDTLSEFIIALENATGCHIECQEFYILVTDDPKAGAILQTVFGGNGSQPITTVKKAKKLKPKKKRRQQLLYTILDGPNAGKEFMGPSLALMIKAGNLAEGTHVSHPVKGKLQLCGTWPDAHWDHISGPE